VGLVEAVGIFYCHLIYFSTIWYIFGHSAYFWVIWNIFTCFGMLSLEKSGNPGENVKNVGLISKHRFRRHTRKTVAESY
jgi:hypothetical protein